jgi:hypothetical protein
MRLRRPYFARVLGYSVIAGTALALGMVAICSNMGRI